MLLAAAAASLQLGAAPAAFAAPSLVPYEDDKDAFSMQVPEGWTFAMPQASTDRFRCAPHPAQTPQHLCTFNSSLARTQRAYRSRTAYMCS